MSSVLQEFGYPPLNAMEDAYSEKHQLEMLQEFKDKYLNLAEFKCLFFVGIA